MVLINNLCAAAVFSYYHAGPTRLPGCRAAQFDASSLASSRSRPRPDFDSKLCNRRLLLPLFLLLLSTLPLLCADHSGQSCLIIMIINVLCSIIAVGGRDLVFLGVSRVQPHN